MKLNFKKVIGLTLGLLYLNVSSATEESGNFALHMSLQPASLFALGQSNIEKNDLQLYFQPIYFKRKTEHYTDLSAIVLYGFSDELTLTVTQPYAKDYYSNGMHSTGFNDSTAQLEYAYFEKGDYYGTLVGSVTGPNGSFYKEPSTGLGGPSFFVGTTMSKTTKDWLLFVSPGISSFSSFQDFRAGNQFLYQCGVGRNLLSAPKKYIFNAMLELDGEYTSKSKLAGFIDPDSGGNVIYLSPSLWYSNNSIIVQAGVALPVVQNLNGIQDKRDYIATVSLGWTPSP